MKYSEENKLMGKTLVDNYFIHDFLPVSPENYVKIYLYGLYLLSLPHSSLADMTSALSVTDEEVLSAYVYFEQYDLVDILSKDPLSVEYRKLTSFSKPKKLKAAKYADLALEIQALLPERMVTASEYAEYFNFIEAYSFQPGALLLIIKYCTMLKGGSIGYKYILAVARNWASRNLKTVADCENELLSYSRQSAEISQLLSALGVKSFEGDIISFYTTWTKDLGFSHETLLFAASLTKKQKGGIEKLNLLLTELFKRKKFTKKEIEDYFALKDKTKNLAYSINKALGIYSKRIDTEIENYVAPWQELGFDGETLERLASHCYRVGISTLEGMNGILQKLWHKGLISLDSINHYIEEKTEKDNQILKILDILKISRGINSYDRQVFKTWTQSWNFSTENIFSACELCKDMLNPIMNVHKLLAYCKDNKIYDSQKIKNCGYFDINKKKQSSFQTRNYSDDDFRILFGED